MTLSWRERYLTRTAWAIGGLGLAHFVIDWMSDSPALVIAHLKDRYDLSATHVGFWMAIFSISASLLQVPLGWFFQKIGWLQPGGFRPSVMKLIILLVLISSITMGFVPIPQKPALNLLLLAFSGLAIATFHPLGAGLVYLLCRRDQAFWMGIFISSGVVGFAFGPWFVGLTLNHGENVYTLAQTLVGILVIPWILLLFRRVDIQKIGSVPEKMNANNQFHRIPWAVILNLYVLVVIREWAKLGMITYWPLMMRKQGWTDADIGFWLSLFLLPGPLMGWAVGAWADRAGGRRVLMILQWCTLIAWCGYFFLPITPTFRLVWFVLAGTALVATTPLNVVMAQRLAPQHLGLVTALMMGFAWGASGLLLPVLGALADRLSLELVLHFPILVSLISIALIALLPDDGPIKTQTPVRRLT